MLTPLGGALGWLAEQSQELSSAPAPLLLAATHLSPWICVPFGAAAGLGLGVLWWKFGGPQVPASRRRIRRVSTVVALILVPILVAGLCFIDPNTTPRHYAEVWTLAIALVFVLVLLAVVDVLNSVRLHANDHFRETDAAGRELDEAMRTARRERAAAGASRAGFSGSERGVAGQAQPPGQPPAQSAAQSAVQLPGEPPPNDRTSS